MLVDDEIAARSALVVAGMLLEHRRIFQERKPEVREIHGALHCGLIEYALGGVGISALSTAAATYAKAEVVVRRRRPPGGAGKVERRNVWVLHAIFTGRCAEIVDAAHRRAHTIAQQYGKHLSEPRSAGKDVLAGTHQVATGRLQRGQFPAHWRRGPGARDLQFAAELLEDAGHRLAGTARAHESGLRLEQESLHVLELELRIPVAHLILRQHIVLGADLVPHRLVVADERIRGRGTRNEVAGGEEELDLHFLAPRRVPLTPLGHGPLGPAAPLRRLVAGAIAVA